MKIASEQALTERLKTMGYHPVLIEVAGQDARARAGRSPASGVGHPGAAPAQAPSWAGPGGGSAGGPFLGGGFPGSAGAGVGRGTGRLPDLGERALARADVPPALPGGPGRHADLPVAGDRRGPGAGPRRPRGAPGDCGGGPGRRAAVGQGWSATRACSPAATWGWCAPRRSAASCRRRWSAVACSTSRTTTPAAASASGSGSSTRTWRRCSSLSRSPSA